MTTFMDVIFGKTQKELAADVAAQVAQDAAEAKAAAKLEAAIEAQAAADEAALSYVTPRPSIMTINKYFEANKKSFMIVADGIDTQHLVCLNSGLEVPLFAEEFDMLNETVAAWVAALRTDAISAALK